MRKYEFSETTDFRGRLYLTSSFAFWKANGTFLGDDGEKDMSFDPCCLDSVNEFLKSLPRRTKHDRII